MSRSLPDRLLYSGFIKWATKFWNDGRVQYNFWFVNCQFTYLKLMDFLLMN